MTNAQDASDVAAYNLPDAQRENEALRAENKRLRRALEAIRDCWGGHSELWGIAEEALK